MGDSSCGGSVEVARPLHLIPFGTRIRHKGSKLIGPIVGYLINMNGPLEYVVALPAGRSFVPLHMAVPLPVSGRETRGSVRGHGSRDGGGSGKNRPREGPKGRRGHQEDPGSSGKPPRLGRSEAAAIEAAKHTDPLEGRP